MSEEDPLVPDEPGADPAGAGAAHHSVRARAVAASASRWIASASYLEKWIVLGVLIGVIAGAGAVVFYQALVAATHLFLGLVAGTQVPTPVREGGVAATAATRPWALPLVTGGGAALAGLLVFGIAPEAEGHGTDAAISAVHHNPRDVRFRAVLVKIVASALTLGSGGSGGREGPVAQISAGFGSLLTRVLDLTPADGRIAVATGIGSGIGAIFSAPLGGAVLAAEIVYRDDFDPQALLPCFIASAVSYTVFGAAEGFGPLFGSTSYSFHAPVQLAWFALIGVLGGLVGLLYAKGFYGLADVFHRLPLPRWVVPATGGVLVGAIGIAVPEVLGTGWGWVQEGLGHQLLGIPLWIVVALPFARILTTGLSIGSGGSGGIFGPGVVIGAFVGAAVWRVFEPIVPSMGHDPAPYVIVGMMCCFGSISRAPLAITVMVAEMTGGLGIVAPAMIAVALAWMIVRRSDDTIYRSQLRTRADAPAQRLLAGLPLLGAIPTQRAMSRPRMVVRARTPVAAALAELRRRRLAGAPVVDEAGRFQGTVRLDTLAASAPPDATAGGRADVAAPAVPATSRLDVALEALATAPGSWVPVLDDDRRVVGTLSVSDLVSAYRRELLANVERIGGLGRTAGTFDLRVDDGSPAAGTALRQANLPKGVLVTSVRRGNDVLVPSGDTVLAAGDILSLLGRREAAQGLEDLGVVAPLAGHDT